MRDLNRLYSFYDKLREMHMIYFPDWRFGQLIYNLEKWIKVNKKVEDLFYIEEDAMLRYLNEYVEQYSLK